MRFYLMIGLPGSGKSTYALNLKEQGVVYISSDEIREKHGSRQNLSNDRLVFKEMRKLIKENLLNGYDVVCDATNVTLGKRSSFLNEIQNIDCEKIAIWVKRDINTCIKQNEQRPKDKQVPRCAIYKLQKVFVEPTLEEGFTEIKIV